MVADYFALLEKEEQSQNMAPLTRSLHGALRGGSSDENDYRRHLEEKYL